jgi:pyruvate dehydrogenase E2 component (dihydrolipoamide acetyltransferase)
MYDFKLPDLGEGIHEGEILKWYVSVGDTIKEDDALIDVETDKAAVTIPSPKSGKITALNGKVGDIIHVGNVIASFDDSGQTVVSAPPPVESKPAVSVSPSVVKKETKAIEVGKIIAAPATRRLARELGIDISQISGSGPAGRVMSEDLTAPKADKPKPTTPPTPEAAERLAEAEFAAHAASAIPFLDIEPLPDFAKEGPVDIIPLRSIRRKVAHKMVTSMILIPHVAHLDEADITDLDKFIKEEKVRRKGASGEKLTILAIVIKAVSVGLKAAPSFNASLDPFKQEIIHKKYYNIGIAVDTGQGLVVPVIKNADKKSIIAISQEIVTLAEKARDKKIDLADLQGGTFTITNIGPLGGSALLPTINYPEVAILGMGRAQEKPVVRDGQIVIRKMLPLTLAFDHRIADGADAARFVSALMEYLADPNKLLMEA